MSSPLTDLHKRIKDFNSPERTEPRREVDKQHQYLLTHYPKDSWSSMSLNDYALGQEEHPESFCWAMEFKCRKLGSIGGRANKHIIYYKKAHGWNYDPALGSNEQQAWETVRAGFLQMFKYADDGEWEKVDNIECLNKGKALRLKTLYVYYQDQILPINSYSHLKIFLGLLNNPLSEDESGDVVRLNRELLKELRSLPGTSKLSNHDLMVVLYEWNNPKSSLDNADTLSPEDVEKLMLRFRGKYPDFQDFKTTGKLLREQELDYKKEVLKSFHDMGGSVRIQELLAAGKGLEAVELLSNIVNPKLVSPSNWQRSFGETDKKSTAVLGACIQVASQAYAKPSNLSAIFNACKKQKIKPAWDALSTTLWLLLPSDYFPIKVKPYRDLAGELEIPFPDGRPGTNKFAQAIKFGRTFYKALEPFLPNDWVDVQSFISSVCPQDIHTQSNYWVFQAVPKKYDLPAALRSGEKINWSVNQHREDITRGDKVILWTTGGQSGCYALGTVCSEIYELDDEFGALKVDLQIDMNLADTPLLKKVLTSSKTFKDFNGGKQGTNLAATAMEYDTIREMGGILLESRNYWIYAPGENAKFWAENQSLNRMTIGWDQTGTISNYDTREHLHQALAKVLGKKDPRNDSLALWQFYKEIQPGDIIIVKMGKSKYLGYGIVSGDYVFDDKRTEHKHTRAVEWKKVGEWDETQGPIALKTLTNITTYLDYITRLKKLIGIDQSTEKNTMKEPMNKILYGPPGTGKTYELKNKYFERYTVRQATQSPEQLADELAGNLAWWEVIAMVIMDLKQVKVGDILKHPLMLARIMNANVVNKAASAWSTLQAHTKLDCEHVNTKSRLEPLLFEKSADSFWTIDEKLAEEQIPELQERLKRWHEGPQSATDEKCYAFTTFHQSYTYEDFIEGIKPVLSDESIEGQLGYELKAGVFKEIARKARANPSRQYALFIDEINRGNVASIFGELITLIEADKREGAANELSAVLPYSRESFTVPANLDIIGTMNTADRSVEALDTALRRRFEFEEMAPDLKTIEPTKVNDIDLQKLLGTINSRIEQLLDKDHCIGHSYLIGIKSISDLQKAFANKILPLLEEYFYNDPARIGMVLGSKFVEQRINGSAKVDLAKGPWQDDMDEDRILYTIHNPLELDAQAYLSIYDA